MSLYHIKVGEDLSLICEQGPSMIAWLLYIIDRGGAPTVKKMEGSF